MKIKGKANLDKYIYPKEPENYNTDFYAEIELSPQELAGQMSASEIEDLLVCRGFLEPKPKIEEFSMVWDMTDLQQTRMVLGLMGNKLNEVIRHINKESK